MLSNPKFLIKFTTRSRPTNFIRGLDNIVENIQTDNYIILCYADINDNTMANEAMKEKVKEYDKVKLVFGHSLNKIDAINQAVWMVDDFSILINWSDDLLWVTKSFDQFIIEDANKYFPQGDFFLHYPESHTKDRQATVSIMDKKYYDRFGYIYNPIFSSVFADNEALDVAKRLGRHKFIKNQLYEHFHPAWGTAPNDELYKRNEEPIQYRKDGEIYYKRLAENFGL